MPKKKPPATAIPSTQQIEASAIADDQNNGRVILAFDLSSSCVGWALGMDKKLVTYGKFVFKATAEVGEKLLAFEEFIRVLLSTYNPTVLLVEKPVNRRMMNNQRTTEMLGVMRMAWRSHSGGEILKAWLISPKTVKTRLNVKRGRNHDHNKQLMVEKINSLFGLHLKWNRGSKYKSDDDVADAIAVFAAYTKIDVGSE